MTIIAVDVDDTLYDFGSQVREAFFEMAIESGDKTLLKGAYSGYHEWRDLSDVFDWRIVSSAIERVHERQDKYAPFLDSVNTLSMLADKFTIKYVTSRYDRHYDVTADWLSMWGFPKGELICSTHNKTPHLTDCQYLIDDRPKTIIDFVTDFTWKNTHGSESKEKARKAFGLWTPYNRNLTDIRNVYLAPTWFGIGYYLQRKGLIERERYIEANIGLPA